MDRDISIEEMKKIKRNNGITNEMIAEHSGVPLGTVQKIFAGISKAPRKSTIDKLGAYFFGLDDRTIEERYDDYMKHHYHPEKEDGTAGRVSDNIAEYTAVRSEHVRTRFGIPYKEQGTYTVEDYFMIPGDIRVELIDGVIYKVNAPSPAHQLVLGELHRQFADYIRAGRGECLPFMAPLCVELDDLENDNDKDNIVQPDMMVICKDRRNRILRMEIYGAPDLVIEVISPSTRKKDTVDKLHAYQRSGVREYWIVDLEGKRILVYDFSAEIYPAIYGFRDSIPVGIYGGDLTVDFAEIDDFLVPIMDSIPPDAEEEEEFEE